MTKYEIRTQEKKKAIINAALELFKEKGFVAVSIKEIAARANVSQVSIYNYFCSKEALVRECTNLLMQETLQKTRALLTVKMDFKEKLLKAFELCNIGAYESLYDYFSTKALNDKVLLNLFTESTHRQKMEIFREFAELGKREGAIDSSISTATIMDFIEALKSIHAVPGSAEEMKIREIELSKLFLYGILGCNRRDT